MERIIVNDISKKFKIGFRKNQSVLERIVSLFSGKEPRKTIWALRDLSFTAKAGEIAGIIGENGSGKSTLLRTIAGIYNTDKGNIITNGKIIPLINLNNGVQERLTMKDNIYLICSLFGLDQKDIKQRFNPIAAFAELENFENTKLYQFSSGMVQRLVFSIAAHCDPEILLLDEVFAIGDENFRNKSAEKIKGLVKNGSSAILVSQELLLIEKYCDRVIWLDKGKIVKEGETAGVIKDYLKNIG